MAELPDGWNAEPDGLRLEGRAQVDTDGSEVTVEMRPVAAVYRVTLDEDAVQALTQEILASDDGDTT